MAAERGLILVDNKYEFGIRNGEVILIDEIHTPDSSRYFYAEGYEERQERGEPQKQLSKEFVRQWLIENGFQGKEGQQIPNMTEEYTESVSERYIELFENIIGEKFVKADISDINERIEKNVVNCNKHYLVYNLSRLATNYDKRDNIKSNEALVLETCRGCMFKCKFCTYELIGKKKTDNYIREKEDLKQEIINNYNLWGTHKYIISDDTFNENPNKIDILYEISQEIDFKVNYWCLARVDLIKRFPESINKMISAGITSYFFGVETFNERSASCIGKGFSGDKLKNYLLDLKQKYPDIDLGAGLIVGLPYESLFDFEKNLDWCYSKKIFNSITLNSLFIPREGNLTETSIFSSDYKKYGYSEMSLEEIKNVHENDIIENLTNKPINWADTENYLKKYLPWKNEHLNFIESSKYVESITEKVRSSNSNESGLFCFLNSFNNQDVVYEHKFSIRNMLQIHRFVSQYIKHKISI
jgi:radical SAM superfamily enzyme YgiQ (UPF0313 family)